MKVLMVNKFLYPNGGSETYVFQLGDYLKSQGHEVQYFGMEHEGRCVGNAVNSYTSNMDFHVGNKLVKLTYPIKTIYSSEARKKIRLVLNDFKPDVVHMNNFNFQLTPSVILEIKKWSKSTNHAVRIVYTAHDYQLICPNHMMYNPQTRESCEKCIDGNFINCAAGKCIHASVMKSMIGALEGYFWRWRGVYKYISTFICPSDFMKSKMDTNPLFKLKTVAIHNFTEVVKRKQITKKKYVFFFGRFSQEKGIRTLIEVCKDLPQIQFVFAGAGPLECDIKNVLNIQNAGFQKGADLEKLIREAAFSVYPSEWYENCPFSVMESQMCGTPVLGANIGGIPELIEVNKTGELFESGNKLQLKSKIEKMWNDRTLTEQYSNNCKHLKFNTIEQYYTKIMDIYKGSVCN